MAAITSILIGAAVAASVAGTAVQMSAASKARDAQEQQLQAQQQEVEDQRKIEAQRQQAMELDARRKQLEIIRNQQRARALALATTTSQGASYGTALGGAYGQISGQANTNSLGISQNLDIGRNIFGLNNDISNARMAYYDAGFGLADAKYYSSIGSGISSLGNDLFKSATPIGNLSKNFFGSNQSGPNLQGGVWPA